MIKVIGVNKKYNEKIIFNNLNLTFNDTGLYLIVGKSGVGKTTLLSLLSSFNDIDSGQILYNEKSIYDIDYVKDHVGFVFQENNLINGLTVFENLLVVSNEDDIKNILGKFEILDLIDKRVNNLSGGEKQRVCIVRAILKNINILLFDEPSSSLDNNISNIMFNFIKKISKEKLCIVVTHDLVNATKYADYIIDLEKSEVCSANHNKLLLNEDKYYINITKAINFIDSKSETSNFILNENNYNDIKTLKTDVSKKILENDFPICLQSVYNYQDKISYKTKNNFKDFFKIYFKKNYLCKIYKKFISIFILSVALCFLIIFFIISSFDKNYNIKKIVETKQEKEVLLYKQAYNKFQGEKYSIDTGVNFYNNLIKDFNSNNVIYSSEVNINGFKYYLNYETSDLKENEVIITDYLYEYLLTNEQRNLNELNINDEKYKIVDVLKTDYQNSYLFKNQYYFDDSNELYNDDIKRYCNVYLNNKFLPVDDDLRIYGGNFFIQVNSYKTYTENSLSYRNIQNTDYNLVSGKIPATNNEILVSQDVYNEYLKDETKREFAYKDLNKSLSAESYYSYVNMYAILDTVKIVGVFDSNSGGDVLVSADTFNSINNDFVKTQYQYKIKLNNNLDEILKLNYVINFSYIQTLESLDEAINQDFSGTIATIKILFIILVVFLSILNLKIIFDSKKNDLAIFKSLDINKKSIAKLFIMYISLILLLTAIVSFIILSILLFTLNNEIKKSLAIEINILENKYFFYIFAINILLHIGLTYGFLQKIKNINTWKILQKV